MSPALLPITPRHVAVIGAGAAGLVAAKELRQEGHDVVVFERGDRVGGTWVYTPEVDSDPVGLDRRRAVVHSSIYRSLRTNLPREVMGFRDYPFVSRYGKSRDPRRYPGHPEVLTYLQEYAAEFGVGDLVRLETEVMRVGLVEDGKWRVRSRRRGRSEDGLVDEVFDAVVVCNGHYTEPRVAEDVPGIQTWPGKQVHSHNYRVPEPFRDRVVVLIGSSASAVDISREIADVAKQVHIASRDGTFEYQLGHDRLWLHPMIRTTHEDGTVVFQDGASIQADGIIHCTGYKYHFPFLGTQGIVSVDDNRVGPLYKHIFPPLLAPWLSFVGLPFKVVPFYMYEFQCKWVASVLSGRVTLPSPDDMLEDVRAFYSELEASATPKRYTHKMGRAQFEYNDWLAAQCGLPQSEEWRKEMNIAASKNKRARPETYRDEWEDEHLINQALEDFKKYTKTETNS